MANESKQLANVSVTTTLATTDRVVVITNPSTTANVKIITVSNFANNIVMKYISNTAPASNTSNGVTGEIAYDSSHVYICVANNTWGRAALSLSW
jgi:hypothetical protein